MISSQPQSELPEATLMLFSRLSNNSASSGTTHSSALWLMSITINESRMWLRRHSPCQPDFCKGSPTEPRRKQAIARLGDAWFLAKKSGK
jgi:hypothetical protein